jgi:hypothetical protein
VFKQEKYPMIKERSATNAKDKKEEQTLHQKLNPKRPTQAEQAKLKSPMGFIFQPKYPAFLKDR